MRRLVDLGRRIVGVIPNTVNRCRATPIGARQTIDQFVNYPGRPVSTDRQEKHLGAAFAKVPILTAVGHRVLHLR